MLNFWEERRQFFIRMVLQLYPVQFLHTQRKEMSFFGKGLANYCLGIAFLLQFVVMKELAFQYRKA